MFGCRSAPPPLPCGGQLTTRPPASPGQEDLCDRANGGARNKPDKQLRVRERNIRTCHKKKQAHAHNTQHTARSPPQNKTPVCPLPILLMFFFFCPTPIHPCHIRLLRAAPFPRNAAIVARSDNPEEPYPPPPTLRGEISVLSPFLGTHAPAESRRQGNRALRDAEAPAQFSSSPRQTVADPPPHTRLCATQPRALADACHRSPPLTRTHTYVDITKSTEKPASLFPTPALAWMCCLEVFRRSVQPHGWSFRSSPWTEQRNKTRKVCASNTPSLRRPPRVWHPHVFCHANDLSTGHAAESCAAKANSCRRRSFFPTLVDVVV